MGGTSSQKQQSKGGSTSSQTQTTSNPLLEETLKSLRENIADPLTKVWMPALMQMFQTGGAASNLMPLVSSTVGSLRSGTSAAMTGIKEMLAKSGLLNTPFGQRILAQTSSEGERQASLVSPNIATQMINQIPSLMTGAQNLLVSGSRGLGTTSTEGTTASWGQTKGAGTGVSTGSDMGSSLMGFMPDPMSLLGGMGGAGIAGFGAGGAAGGFAPAAAGSLGTESMLEMAPLLSLMFL